MLDITHTKKPRCCEVDCPVGATGFEPVTLPIVNRDALNLTVTCYLSAFRSFACSSRILLWPQRHVPPDTPQKPGCKPPPNHWLFRYSLCGLCCAFESFRQGCHVWIQRSICPEWESIVYRSYSYKKTPLLRG